MSLYMIALSVYAIVIDCMCFIYVSKVPELRYDHNCVLT